ncbi:MAG: hypothetical protein AB7V77_03240 [Candidatus Woesearchaeota archaeon]
MESKIKNKIILIMMLLIIGLFFTSCGEENYQETDYYVGSEGVEALFRPNSPPSKVYYYEDTPDDNFFDILVEVHNKGTSYTKGGVYLSGYDPSMIKIEGIDIQKTGGDYGDCNVQLGFTSNPFPAGNSNNVLSGFWNAFAGSFDCQDEGVAGYYSDPNVWGVEIDNLGDFLGEEFEGVAITYDNGGGYPQFGLNIEGEYGIDYMNHGKGLLIMFSGMSFNWYNGRQYLLKPDTIDYPGGERTTEEFNVQIYSWQKGLDRIKNQPFLMTNCYLYTTFANEMVCIDPSPYEERTKVCTSKPIYSSSGQGAPVAVTKIVPEPTKTKILFDITIENIGNGIIFDPGYMNKCGPYGPGLLKTNELNKVYLLDVRIGNQQLVCDPDRGEGVELVNGKRDIRCTYYIDYQSVKSTYETPLVIELGYGYQETSIANVEIKRV